MPSAAILEKKKQLVSDLTEKLKEACAGVIVQYEGINVEDDTKLRRELREAGVEYRVIKNTYLRFALEGAGITGLDDVLEGTTAVATSKDDEIAAARVLCKYAETSDTFKVKAGFSDGKSRRRDRDRNVQGPRQGRSLCNAGRRTLPVHRRSCPCSQRRCRAEGWGSPAEA